jgi:hypothetical protein
VTPVSYLETGVIYCDENLDKLAQFPGACSSTVWHDVKARPHDAASLRAPRAHAREGRAPSLSRSVSRIR